MTIVLFIPSQVRRSKERILTYTAIHSQLAAEVAAMREACSEEVLAAALELALADLTRDALERIRESF